MGRRPAPCPPEDGLRRFLDADPDATPAESEALGRHIETCRDCQATLDRLTADPGLELHHNPAAETVRDFPSLQSLRDTPPAPRDPAAPKAPGPAAPALPGYEVVRELGRGGAGVVYLARDLRLNREVAVKVILHGAHAGPNAVERFRAEALAVAGLGHPGVVRVFQVGEAGGLPYCVMEYVPGGSLRQRLAAGPVPPREAARLVEQAARAVHAVHEEGYVHRDLKPENLLLGAGGEPKVADFGLVARLPPAGGAASSAPRLTRTGDLVGTPGYMAPEQVAGPATDVYALGVILYELLTGRTPFDGDGSAATLTRILSHEPRPPRRLAPAVPRDLETVCLKCLRKDPPARYPVALDLADDLRRFLDGRPVLARPVGPLARGWRWSRRNPWLAFGLAVLATLVLTLAVGGPVAAFREAELVGRLTDQNADLAATGERERAAGEAAARAAERAQAQAGHSRRAADQMLRVVLEAVQRSERADAEQLQTLQRVLGVYERAVADVEKPPETEGRIALTQLYMSVLHLRLGDAPAAAADALGGVDRWWEALARFELGRALDRAGRPDEARAAYAQAAAVEKAVPPADVKPGAWEKWGETWQERGVQLLRDRRFADAAPFFREALRIAAARPADPPSPARRALHALATSDLAAALLETGPRDEAAHLARDGLTRLETLAAEQPARTEFRGDVAKAYHRLGLCQSDRPEAALPVLKKAAALFAVARAQTLPSPNQQYYESLCRCDLGRTLDRLGQAAAAEAEYRAALKGFGELRAGKEAQPSDTICFAQAASRLAALRAAAAGPAAGVGELNPALAALAALEQLPRNPPPGPPEVPPLLAELYGQRALYLTALARHAEAAKDWGRAAGLEDAPRRAPLRVRHCLALARAGEGDAAVPIAEELAKDAALPAAAALDLARCYALAAASAKDADQRSGRAAAAVALIRRAHSAGALGGPAVKQLRADPDFAPLAGRDDYKQFLATLK